MRSDVWSLGITLMEVATGNFPYRKWGSVFEQLCQVQTNAALTNYEFSVKLFLLFPSGRLYRAILLV